MTDRKLNAILNYKIEKGYINMEEGIAKRRYNKLFGIPEPEVKNREGLIMDFVKIYQSTGNTEQVKKDAKEKLTAKEYNVFLFEIENKGV